MRSCLTQKKVPRLKQTSQSRACRVTLRSWVWCLALTLKKPWVGFCSHNLSTGRVFSTPWPTNLPYLASPGPSERLPQKITSEGFCGWPLACACAHSSANTNIQSTGVKFKGFSQYILYSVACLLACEGPSLIVFFMYFFILGPPLSTDTHY